MGKTIVITGAGDGLGRALARRFAADGDTVILLGRTGAKIEAVAAELGGPHRAIVCDVSQPASVKAAFAAIAEDRSSIDVLVNNAAVYEPFTLAEASDDQVMALTLTNFVGPVLVAREALPLLRGGGHIINVTTESTTLRMPMLWLYEGTKEGLEFMSMMWARELEPDGIRVTTVRAGQMMDETKTGSSWPREVSMRFAEANAKVGIHLRDRPISHYDSAAAAFRAVIDTPADLHMDMVSLCARRADASFANRPSR